MEANLPRKTILYNMRKVHGMISIDFRTYTIIHNSFAPQQVLKGLGNKVEQVL